MPGAWTIIFGAVVGVFWTGLVVAALIQAFKGKRLSRSSVAGLAAYALFAVGAFATAQVQTFVYGAEYPHSADEIFAAAKPGLFVGAILSVIGFIVAFRLRDGNSSGKG